MEVEWGKTAIERIDVTSTLLSAEALEDMVTRVPGLSWFAAAHVDGMKNSVRKMQHRHTLRIKNVFK